MNIYINGFSQIGCIGVDKRVQKPRSHVGSSVYLIQEVFVHAGVYRRCTSSHASMAPDYKMVGELGRLEGWRKIKRPSEGAG